MSREELLKKILQRTTVPYKGTSVDLSIVQEILSDLNGIVSEFYKEYELNKRYEEIIGMYELVVHRRALFGDEHAHRTMLKAEKLLKEKSK